jgi:hypothetical protein
MTSSGFQVTEGGIGRLKPLRDGVLADNLGEPLLETLSQPAIARSEKPVRREARLGRSRFSFARG